MLTDKLLLLRQTMGLTHGDIAKKLNVTRQAYSMYESGQREMSYESLGIIADFYGVTTDYLLGRADTISTDTLNSEEIDTFTKLRSFNRRDRELVKALIEAIKNT